MATSSFITTLQVRLSVKTCFKKISDDVIYSILGLLGHSFKYGGSVTYFGIVINTTINTAAVRINELETLTAWNEWLEKEVLTVYSEHYF